MTKIRTRISFDNVSLLDIKKFDNWSEIEKDDIVYVRLKIEHNDSLFTVIDLVNEKNLNKEKYVGDFIIYHIYNVKKETVMKYDYIITGHEGVKQYKSTIELNTINSRIKIILYSQEFSVEEEW